jgi:hypothetical protein
VNQNKIQTPCAWNKEKNRMKSLTTSNQPSLSLWGMKPKSLALVATMAIVALGVLIGSQSGQAQGGAVAPQIEGSWQITVSPTDLPPFPSLLTYAAGGGLTGVDGVSNIHGTWARKGGHTFVFTFMELLFDSTGAFTGSVRIQEKSTLEPGGAAYNGVWTGEVLDPNGNVVVPIGGTTHATRINAE